MKTLEKRKPKKNLNPKRKRRHQIYGGASIIALKWKKFPMRPIHLAGKARAPKTGHGRKSQRAFGQSFRGVALLKNYPGRKGGPECEQTDSEKRIRNDSTHALFRGTSGSLRWIKAGGKRYSVRGRRKGSRGRKAAQHKNSPSGLPSLSPDTLTGIIVKGGRETTKGIGRRRGRREEGNTTNRFSIADDFVWNPATSGKVNEKNGELGRGGSFYCEGKKTGEKKKFPEREARQKHECSLRTISLEKKGKPSEWKGANKMPQEGLEEVMHNRVGARIPETLWTSI